MLSNFKLEFQQALYESCMPSDPFMCLTSSTMDTSNAKLLRYNLTFSLHRLLLSVSPVFSKHFRKRVKKTVTSK